MLFVTHAIEEAILLGDEVVVMTARPGRIKEVIPIDLPRPRSLEMINSHGIRRLVRSHLPSDPRRGHRGDGAAGRDGVGPVMKRSGSRTKFLENALPALSVVMVIVIWEIVVRWRGIAPIFLPAPSSIALLPVAHDRRRHDGI